MVRGPANGGRSAPKGKSWVSGGVGGGKPIDETDTASWRRIVDTNVWGTFLVTRQAVPMLANGGRVINISSVLGRFGVPEFAKSVAKYTGLSGVPSCSVTVPLVCQCQGSEYTKPALNRRRTSKKESPRSSRRLRSPSPTSTAGTAPA